jgi:glycosyltransferase involved in cell wall biosynthesis
MRFSLIVATVGRTQEIARFLESLDSQTCRDFELIIVDQNPDDRLARILAQYPANFEIRVLHSPRGLSRARNAAFPDVRGDLVAFPDDDCWYPPDLLATVDNLLASRRDLDGVCGRCMTATGIPRGRWASRATVIGKYSIFGRCISFTMFLRRALVERIGKFDESLGLGAQSRWRGAEDYDYLLRAAEAGTVLYDPTVEVFHPDLTATFDEDDRAKRYGNALGFGRFLAKHHYPLPFIVYYSSRYLAGAVWSLAMGQPAKARYRWSTLVGNFEGWFAA